VGAAVAAHPTGELPRVAVEGTLVVAGEGGRDEVAPVAERVEAGLLPRDALLDDDPPLGVDVSEKVDGLLLSVEVFPRDPDSRASRGRVRLYREPVEELLRE